jgi:hypothetical protein
MNNLNDGPERVEEAVDDLARRAGASLRRSAPEGGASAVMSRGSTIRARRVVIGGGTVAVLLIGTLVLRNGRSDSNPDADLPITTTTSATTSTPNATLAPLSATTLAATTTAVAAFTDTATPDERRLGRSRGALGTELRGRFVDRANGRHRSHRIRDRP